MLVAEMTSREFGSLFMKYKDRYVSIARSYVRDSAVAEDIVADSFAKFWDRRHEISIDSVPEAYILQTVKNRCINHLRDTLNQMRIQQQIHSDKYRTLAKETEILSSEDISFLFNTDITSIFANILKEVPELSKNVFIASRFRGMTYKEIAEKYNVSERKVKREISKVLELMRIGLKDYLPLLLFLFPGMF